MDRILILTIFVTLLGCKPTQFTNSTSNPTSGSAHTIDEKASAESKLKKSQLGALEEGFFVDESSSGKAVVPLNGEGISITLAKSLTKTGEKTEAVSPLSIYFVLDRSTSMNPVLSAMKSSVTDFARALAFTGYDVMMGALAFRDQVDVSQPLSKIEEFQAFVDRLDTTEILSDINGDLPEGSLGASLQAIQNIESEDSRPNAERIIVTVTDIVGHLGGPSLPPAEGRNCDPKPLANALSFSQRVKFFYSVPSGAFDLFDSSSSCTAFAGPSAQFGQILDEVKSSQEGVFVGQALAYPFDGKFLATQLLPIITKTLPPKTLACTVKEVKVSDPASGKILAKSSSPVVSGDDKVIFKNLLSANLVKEWAEKTLQLDVSRCCTANGNACSSQFSNSISFLIKSKS